MAGLQVRYDSGPRRGQSRPGPPGSKPGHICHPAQRTWPHCRRPHERSGRANPHTQFRGRMVRPGQREQPCPWQQLPRTCERAKNSCRCWSPLARTCPVTRIAQCCVTLRARPYYWGLTRLDGSGWANAAPVV